MHLAADTIFPIRGPGRRGKCRIRIYLPDDDPEGRDAPVVLCSQLEDSLGSSITNACEWIAGDVIKTYELSTPVWIENYPRTLVEKQQGIEETFDLVVFSSYEVQERAPYLGESTREVGEPRWAALDRQSVEVLVGQRV